MNWRGRADVALLALMLANTIVIICRRFYCHSAARRQSRAFLREATAALRGGRLNEVITIAARNSRSHVATVLAAGLAAFASAPSQFTDTEAIAAAQRAFQLSRKMLVTDLKLGLSTLATIASSAPLIGFVGTVYGILYAFGGAGMERSALLALTALGLAQALGTTALGLVVAVLALWCRNYLRDCMEGFESEMSNIALEAVTYLKTHRQWRNRPEHSDAEATSLVFSLPRVLAAQPWEAPYDRQRVLFVAMWFCVLYIAFIFARGMYWSYHGWQP